LGPHQQLPLLLVQGNPDGRGQIQAANVWAAGQSQGMIVMGIENRLGQTGRFASKDKYVTNVKVNVPEGAFGKSREKIERTHRQLSPQLLPIHGITNLQMLPIVKPRTAQALIIKPKSSRPNNPQFSPDRDTRTADVSRVLRDLGLIQHYMCDGCLRFVRGGFTFGGLRPATLA